MRDQAAAGRRADRGGHAEVGNIGSTVGVEQNVRCLDVPVHEPFFVEILQGIEHQHDGRYHLIDRGTAQRAQVRPGNELLTEQRVVIVRMKLESAHDMCVHEPDLPLPLLA